MRRIALTMSSAFVLVALLVLARSGAQSRDARAAAQPARQAAAQPARQAAVGSWLLTLTPSNGAEPTPVLFTLHGDGTMAAGELPAAAGALLPAPSGAPGPSGAPASSASPSGSPAATEAPAASPAAVPSELPLISPGTLNSEGQGTWNAVGGSGFTFTYVVLQSDPSGAFVAKVTVSGSATVGDDGEATGSYTMRFSRPDSQDFGSAGEDLGLTSGTLEGDEIQPDLVAAFIYNQGRGSLNVTFTDQSTGDPTDWHWDFGDGAAANGPHPTHRYDETGEFEVFLTVSNAQGTETNGEIITVGEAAPPHAEFVTDQTPNSREIRFSDASSGVPTEWNWDFGDGATSTNRNPTHTYDQAGKYRVKLTVSNDRGEDTQTHMVIVAAPPSADFTFSQPGGNLRVLFTDASTGPPTQWSWDFGDGSNSNRQSPRHVYDDGGDYQVTLTVMNAVGSDSKTQTVTVANETGIPLPSGG